MENETKLDKVLGKFGIERRAATEYPTRYNAFDNQRVLCEQPEPRKSGGYECVVLSVQMRNQFYPHLTDGLYAEVHWNAGCNCFLAAVHVTQPNRSRAQRNPSAKADTYEGALDGLAAMLPEMFRFAGVAEAVR